MGSAAAWDKMIKSAAYKTGTENKSADIVKRIQPNKPVKVTPVSDGKQRIVSRLLDDASYVKGHEPELSEQTQDYLAQFSFDSIASTLASLGILLRPEEFQRIVLIKLGHRKLAETLAAKRLVFDEGNPGTLPTWANHFGTFDPDAMDEKIALAIRPYMADRSVYPEILIARLNRFEKQATVTYERDSPWWPMTDEQMRASSGMPGVVPASLALASAYIAYKNVLPAILGEGSMAQVLKKSWFIPILVGAGVGASVGVSTMLGKRPLGGSEKLSSVDAIGRAQYHTQKTATADAALLRLGVPAAIYAYAGIRRQQARQGRPLSALDRAIVLNPGWASLVGFGLTPSVLKSIAGLSKKAGLAGDVGLYALGSSGQLMPSVLAAGLLDGLIFRGIARLATRRKNNGRQYTR